jgi:hypothetical protein
VRSGKHFASCCCGWCAAISIDSPLGATTITLTAAAHRANPPAELERAIAEVAAEPSPERSTGEYSPLSDAHR